MMERGPPAPLERHELPDMVERHGEAVARLVKALAKPDRRARCPKHGPKDTVPLNGAMRFVCCGRETEG